MIHLKYSCKFYIKENFSMKKLVTLCIILSLFLGIGIASAAPKKPYPTCKHPNKQTIRVEPTCTEYGSVTVKCTRCGKVLSKTKINKIAHYMLPATCTSPSKCKTCKKTAGLRLPHDFKPANCRTPKTCRSCGAKEGGLGPHSFAPATCILPQICRICSTRYGLPNGHYFINGKCVDCGRQELFPYAVPTDSETE